MDLSTPTPPPGSFTSPTPALPTPPPPAPQDSVSNDPLDGLLKQIIGGWFILTDGQGAVSKWSEPAELLFGKEAPDALGVSFFDGLLTGPLSDDADQWRRFLSAGDPPHARALVDVTARHAPTEQRFPLEAVFIPVKLDEGFDFSLFLEDLSFELPMNLMLLRMRQQHPVVVRALRAALDTAPQPWEGWRTAGTLVAFRPLAPTPRRRSRIRTPASTASRSTTSTTRPRSSRGCCPRWSASTSWSGSPGSCRARSKRRCARRKRARRAPRSPSARREPPAPRSRPAAAPPTPL